MDRNDRPNLLGAAFLAFALGAIMLGLSLLARIRGEHVEFEGVLVGVCLFVLGAFARAKHRELAAMTPEERDRYWARKDAEWRDTADAHARAVLGKDYDKK
ncbi:MAG TPA: hypothetical protein VL500_04600 [Candidatus Eisenbacteria bacterium]|nr:hypothetical protein [Candidatus Eisenbacteria bacterium]